METHSHPLRDLTYRRLFSAQVMSLLGTGLTTVALALLAYDLSGGKAGIVLGTVLFLKMVVYLVIAPVIGGIAHRFSRKPFLITLDLLRALIVALLPFVTALWQVYVLVVLLNIAAAGFTPAFQATIPDVLPEEERYTKALSLARLAYDLENLISPTLAALALSFMSYNKLFLADAVTFVVSAVLVSTTMIPSSQVSERVQGLLSNMTFGLRAYLQTPRLRGLWALHFAAAAAGAMVIVNTVVYVRAQLGLGDAETAYAMAAAGCGSMVMAFLIPTLLQQFSERTLMLGGGICLAIGLFLGGLIPMNLLGLMGLWVCFGLGMSAIQTPSGRLVRRSCQPGDRSAFFAAEFALSHSAWLVAYPLAGLIGASMGLHSAFIVLGILGAGGVIFAFLWWPKHDHTSLEHVHEAIYHTHVHVHDEHHDHEHEGWEGPEPHSHPHHHKPIRHKHLFVIDLHHPKWPQ